jgi:hypothetical protein
LSIKTTSWKYVNLGTTINYRQKSFDITASWGGLGGGNDLEMNSKLGFLNINIYPDIGIGDKIRFYLQPGIYIGSLISTKEDGIINIWYIETAPEFRYVNDIVNVDGKSGYMKGPDFGVRLNIGIEFFTLKNFKLVTEGGISRGLSNIGDGSFGSYAGIFNSTNYSLTFGVVYIFRLNKKDILKDNSN